MSFDRDHRQADLFFADLMGRRTVQTPWRRTASLVDEARDDIEGDVEPANLKSGRVVFYDEDTLRFIEGWTRAIPSDNVFLINRRTFTEVRADGRRRSRQFDEYLRRTRFGADLQPPVYLIDPSTHTAPLIRGAAGDWDDLMIWRLMDAGRRLSIQLETDQWAFVNRLFDRAVQEARQANQSQNPAREFVAFFVLDTVRATLTMEAATKVTMQGNHAVITVGRIRGTNQLALPGGDAGQRVIGDIHTHVFLDPLIDIRSTTLGTRRRETATSLHSGVSDVDIASARSDGLVVYAIDSKWLHRANPNGTKDDKLPKSGNVLRQAVRIFGGEPL